MEDIAKKKNHNIMMIDIASCLNCVEFDEVNVSYYLLDVEKVEEIYEGDDNMKRAKEESLRGHFDQMKMREDKDIVKYFERIKEIVSVIRASGGKIEDTIAVRKVLRTLILTYVIRVNYLRNEM